MEFKGTRWDRRFGDMFDFKFRFKSFFENIRLVFVCLGEDIDV